MFNLKQGQVLFLAVIALLSANIFAAELNHKNFYLNGELGGSSMASSHVDPYQFKDKRTFGYRISLGYLFPISSLFSLGSEVGYGRYGKLSYTNSAGLISNYNLAAWDVLATLKYEPTSRLNVYLKGGVGDLSQRLVIVGPGATPGGFYQRAFKPMLVVGTSYNILKQTELSISYTRIFANKAPLTSNQQFTFTNVNQPCSVNAVMVGISYFI